MLQPYRFQFTQIRGSDYVGADYLSSVESNSINVCNTLGIASPESVFRMNVLVSCMCLTVVTRGCFV